MIFNFCIGLIGPIETRLCYTTQNHNPSLQYGAVQLEARLLRPSYENYRLKYTYRAWTVRIKLISSDTVATDGHYLLLSVKLNKRLFPSKEMLTYEEYFVSVAYRRGRALYWYRTRATVNGRPCRYLPRTSPFTFFY